MFDFPFDSIYIYHLITISKLVKIKNIKGYDN